MKIYVDIISREKSHVIFTLSVNDKHVFTTIHEDLDLTGPEFIHLLARLEPEKITASDRPLSLDEVTRWHFSKEG